MRYVLACLLALAVGALAGASASQAASIGGSWRGEGTVKLTSGEAEKVRCRISDQYGVTGEVSISVNGSRQTITAKSPKGSARIVLTKQ
jgi:hypothetical protein